MARKFQELIDKMPREAQEEVKRRTEEAIREMALDELRIARQKTQEQLAETLNVNQAAISKLERRTDVYVSTLRRYIEAMGGRLEMRAIFPEGEVRIEKFGKISKKAS